MMPFIVQAIPTHIITGFLGAGKTTVLQHILQQKPDGETWAVLMNEFGEIGIDQTWIAERGIAVKEVLGGCLCCTSQLPMQIALARLISEYKPTRLFIEPTGLGHPKELIEQLTMAHWQHSLDIRAVTTIVDGHRLHEKIWEKYDIFLQQLDVADIVLISYSENMSAMDLKYFQDLQQAYHFPAKQWLMINHGKVSLSEINVSRQIQQTKKQMLLIQQMQIVDKSQIQEPRTLPYHYAMYQQNFYVAGWHLPKAWQFNMDNIIAILQRLQHIVRIKAKINTEQGWLDINVIPTNFQIDFAAQAGLDNRLEVISEIRQDWQSIERSILAEQLPD